MNQTQIDNESVEFYFLSLLVSFVLGVVAGATVFASFFQ